MKKLLKTRFATDSAVHTAQQGKPLLMGIVNVTPDSFSDGGFYEDMESAVRHALNMVNDGADVIDIGGESTRPGSIPVPAEKEMKRVLPVIERISGKIDVPISVDTYKPEVARAAIERGASIINDITALRYGGSKMAQIAADSDARVVLMHMKGTPATMQKKPHYKDVVSEILAFLERRAEFARKNGIKKSRIIIDPGIGFGKRLEDNLNIIRNLASFRGLGYPVLVGPSRKSFIGTILNLPPEQRLEGSLAAFAICVYNGADIIRVHDVAEARRAVDTAAAIRDA